MPWQRTLDDLGTPLSDVTFCVVDLETTGGSPRDCSITEVGCVKVCRGEVLGTFQTLVNPGCSVPAFVRLLTGISDDMVADAPPVEAVLPSFLEFVREGVLVAHNARFDMGFLNAALASADYPSLRNRVVDTAALARKALSGEVRNHQLATLARHLRCAHQPSHRAYSDALATTDVLHHLIERLAGFGVTTLEDLVAFSYTRADGTFAKISLVEDAPATVGIYRFLGATGDTLYVGKASNLRQRVRSYFYGDPRRKMRNLLREVQRIEFETHATLLEAEIAEARAIAAAAPPYNRAHKRRGRWYLKVTLKKKARVGAVRSPRADGGVYLGPFRGHAEVQTLIDAFRSVTRLHRCSLPDRCRGSAFDQMGKCAGSSGCDQRPEIRALLGSLLLDPGPLWERIASRLRVLAEQGRFEEAVDLRDRAVAAERAVATGAEVDALVAAGDIAVVVSRRLLLFRGGTLAGACDATEDVPGDVERLRAEASSLERGSFITPPVFEEARVFLSWLRREPEQARLTFVERAWSLPPAAARRDRFRPRERRPGQEVETSTKRSRAREAAPSSMD